MSRIVPAVLVLAVLGLALPAQAQIVNVLTPTVKPPLPGFAFGFGEDFQLKYGNTDSLNLDSSLSMRYLEGAHTLMAMAAVDVELVDDEFDTDKQLGHLRYIRQVYDGAIPLSVFIFAQAERDRFRAIVLRTVFGVGLAADLLATENVAATVGVAVMPEYERIRTDVDDEAGYTTRLSFFLTLAAELTPWMTFASTTFVQPALHGRFDTRAFNESAFVLKVSPNFGFKTSLVVAHDTHPPRTVEPTDITLKQGLWVKF